jgi:Ca2+-transporting ATPase
MRGCLRWRLILAGRFCGTLNLSCRIICGGGSKKALTEGGLASPDSPAAHTARHDSASEAFSLRKRVFRDNRLPEKKGKSLLQLISITYNDKVLILLSVAALVSLAVSLYQTFSLVEYNATNSSVEWVEGVVIIVAIAIVVLIRSSVEWRRRRCHHRRYVH